MSKAGQKVILIERGDVAAEGSGRTLGGVRQSARDLTELPLAMEAVRLWRTLAEELGQDIGYRRAGNLRLGMSPADVAFLEQIIAEERAAGLDIELLQGERLRAVAPTLAPSIVAASYCPSDGYVVDPPVVSRAFAQAAQRHGATIRTGVTVSDVEVAGERVIGVTALDELIQASTIVLAAGLGTAALCAGLGLTFPVQAWRAQIAVVRAPALDFAYAFGTADTSLSGRPDYEQGCFRLSSGSGTGTEMTTQADDLTPSPAGEGRILERARQLFTCLAEGDVVRRWCGMIDITPDHKPVLDTLAQPQGLILASGFSGHGYCLGPISGRLISELILTGQPSLPLDAFRWSRFADVSTMQAPSARLQGAIG